MFLFKFTCIKTEDPGQKIIKSTFGAGITHNRAVLCAPYDSAQPEQRRRRVRTISYCLACEETTPLSLYHPDTYTGMDCFKVWHNARTMNKIKADFEGHA